MKLRSFAVFALMLGVTLLLSADWAQAATDTVTPASSTGAYGGGTIGDLLCKVADWFTGSIGQGIATLAVIVLGIGALFGKVSQGMAITTMIGISVIFGAPDIVQDLTGQSACYSGNSFNIFVNIKV